MTMLGTALWLVANSAWACGGFFCDSPADPVVQSGERILFHVDEEAETVTTYVEIQFQGPPIQFGWVLPVPPGVTADDVATAPAGLFDALEGETAPRFVEASYGALMAGEDADVAMDSMGKVSGCGGFGHRAEPWNGKEYVAQGPGFAGIDVVGSAVVGPYALELIEADSGDTFQQWLLSNGYQMPTAASDPLQHNIDSGMNFIGVQLLPETESGPIDTLVFTTPGTLPMIPLRLTAIAATQNMDIVAYTLTNQRMAPNNYVDLPFDYAAVNWVEEGVTDYDVELMFAIQGAGGQAWNTEFAGPSRDVLPELPEALDLLAQGDYLTRFHTKMAPADMTLDPMWTPAPDLLDQPNVHTTGWEEGEWSGLHPLLGMLLIPLVAAGRRRT
jgi:hypothetical protein